MNVAVVHNPRAGRRNVSGHRLRASIRAAGHTVLSYSTDASDCAAAADEAADLVAIAGGDGTVRRVLPQLAGSEIPATIVPLGTVNNVAESLGVDIDDPLDLIGQWQTAPTRRFDLPLVSMPNKHVRVIEAAGVGLFCKLLAVGDAIERALNIELNVTEALALMRELVKRSVPQYYRVVCDGRDLSGEYIAIEAMNVSHIGPNVRIASSDSSDQRFELVMFDFDDRTALIDYLERRACGHSEPLVTRHSVSASHARLRLPLNSSLHVDDRRHRLASRVPRVDVEMDGTQVSIIAAHGEVST